MKGEFDVVLHSPAEQLERQVWADRALGTMVRLAILTGNRPFTGYRGNREVTVDLKRSAIEEMIEANLNREGGQVFAELGSIFGVGMTFPGGDPEVNDVTASFRVGNTEPRFYNGVTVEFVRGITPAQARQLFEAIIPVWKPDWGCVVSDENADARLEEKSPYEQRLHWCTYFGRIAPDSWTSPSSKEIRRPSSAVRLTAASRSCWANSGNPPRSCSKRNDGWSRSSFAAPQARPAAASLW